MKRILIGILWLVLVVSVQAGDGDEKPGSVIHDIDVEGKIPPSTTANSGEHSVLQRELQESTPYMGVVDVIDSPIKLNATLVCSYGTQRLRAKDGDLFQLNLQADHCHTIKVNSLDSRMNVALAIYDGVTTSDSVETFFAAGKIVDGVGINKLSRTAQVKLAPIADDGKFTLSVYPAVSFFLERTMCDGGSGNYDNAAYDYEIEIEREPCVAGQVSYAGIIDVNAEATTMKASLPCEPIEASSIQRIPEFWQLWRVNLSPRYCYTFTVNRLDCEMSPSLSLYKGIATSAVPGSDARDPNALTGATFLNGPGGGSRSGTKYCGSRAWADYGGTKSINDPRLELDDPDIHDSDGVFTVAVHYGSNENYCDGSYEYELEVQPRLCDSGLLSGLRETCSYDIDCASGLCTGRPGKTKKCRFCARKKELCEVDEDCCQSEKFPGRYCNNGQCKKRPPVPQLLALSLYPVRYFVVDAETGAPTKLEVDLPASLEDIEYDSGTQTLYGIGGTSLFKMNSLSGAVIEELPLTGWLSAMEFVEDKLYAIHGSSLVTVDTSSGALTTIGSITTSPGIPSAGIPSSLSYDGTTMYGFSRGYLITINLDTATIMSSVQVTSRSYGSIEFGPDGVLYAVFQPGALYSIDKDTGNSTLIGNYERYEAGDTFKDFEIEFAAGGLTFAF